jgi:hypothetical protein
MRTKGLHLYLLDMSQLCNYYTNPHFFLFLYADKGIAPIPTGHEPVVQLLHQSAFILYNSPVQVSHLLLPITKRVHCFYANQAQLTG